MLKLSIKNWLFYSSLVNIWNLSFLFLENSLIFTCESLWGVLELFLINSSLKQMGGTCQTGKRRVPDKLSNYTRYSIFFFLDFLNYDFFFLCNYWLLLLALWSWGISLPNFISLFCLLMFNDQTGHYLFLGLLSKIIFQNW